MPDKDDEIEYLKTIAGHLEKMNLGAYVELLQNPRHLIFLNLVAGAARGFGTAIGWTILLGIIVFVLRKLLILDLPFVGGLIAELVRIVQANLGSGTP